LRTDTHLLLIHDHGDGDNSHHSLLPLFLLNDDDGHGGHRVHGHRVHGDRGDHVHGHDDHDDENEIL
jgi:hypothetical protein